MQIEELSIGAAIGAALTLIGTLVLGVLAHLRGQRKLDMEAVETQAAAKLADESAEDMHHKRMTAEITRLDTRVERLERDVRECHKDRVTAERERDAFARELELIRLNLQMRGNNRETAQLVVSELRKEGEGNAG